MDPDEVDQAQSILVVEGIRADKNIGGFQVPMRERPLVKGADQPGQRGRESANARSPKFGRQSRQELADVGRQVDSRLFLDGDQVGLVGEEPEDRVAPERSPLGEEREILRRRDSAAGEVLTGLPRTPGPRRTKQVEERVRATSCG